MLSPRTKVVGLVFVSAGIALCGAWALWTHTRVNRAVDLPISMARGHIRSSEFRVNVNTPYTIAIEVESGIQNDTVLCLLDISTDKECDDRQSVVKASWVLTSDGRVVANGSSDDFVSGGLSGGEIIRYIGRFQCQSRRPYVLDVDFISDGTSLALGKPRLKVDVSLEVYEARLVLRAILYLTVVVLILIGAILLAVSFAKNRRIRNVALPGG